MILFKKQITKDNLKKHRLIVREFEIGTDFAIGATIQCTPTVPISITIGIGILRMSYNMIVFRF